MIAVPTSGTMGSTIRRVVLLDRARSALGGAAKLADVLGLGRRAVNYKLAADRRVTDREMLAVADAIERRARELEALAADLRGVLA